MRWLVTLFWIACLALLALPGCGALVGIDFGAVHLDVDATSPDPPGGMDGSTTDPPRPDGGCVAKSCKELGFVCGTQNDGCDNAIECGTCAGATLCQNGKCQCQPKTCAELSATCGTVDDGCGGALACGSCAAPNVCDVTSTSSSCACKQKTCADLGANCGTIPDGCGDTLDCGTCSGGDSCGGGGPNKCGTAPCTPTSCAAQGDNCASISNGCGVTLNCGTCTLPDTCGGGAGGKPNVCGCTPTTCAAQGKNCSSIPDGCGGTLDCGSCASPDTCGGGGTANVCGCTPTTCSALGDTCGAPSNNCGGTLSCGSCTSPDTCGGGGKGGQCGCTPTTCAAGGYSCGLPPDGCGGRLNSCGICPVGEECSVLYRCTVMIVTCFPGGTRITMADGSRLAIERIRVGDSVLGYDASTGKLVAAPVLETKTHPAEESAEGFVVVNGALRLTPNHPVFTPGGPKRADALVPGDAIVTVDSKGRAQPDVVRSAERRQGQESTYDLVVGAPGTFIAEGTIVLIKVQPE